MRKLSLLLLLKGKVRRDLYRKGEITLKKLTTAAVTKLSSMTVGGVFFFDTPLPPSVEDSLGSIFTVRKEVSRSWLKSTLSITRSGPLTQVYSVIFISQSRTSVNKKCVLIHKPGFFQPRQLRFFLQKANKKRS